MNEVKELVEFDKIAAGIAEIQDKGNFIPDMSTKEGYEASKRFVLDMTTPARTKLNTVHKNAKAYWVAGGKAIDAKKNEIMDILVDIQQPHQEAYKAKDQEEKDRKAKFEADLQARIDVLYNYRVLPNGSTSQQITDLIQECGETDTQDGYYHRATDAFQVRAESLDILNDALMQCVAYEAEQAKQAELAEQNRIQQEQLEAQQEKMRLQQEEMDRKQAEIDRKENEAAEVIRQQEAEKQRVIDENARIEREKQEAIEREEYAKQQAEIAAENAKQAEIQRQKEQATLEQEAAEKREANKRHNAKVHNGILEVLTANGISEEDGKTMIKLAAKRELPNLQINY